ncbi:MAG: hypothetical protein RLZ71_46 [Actinomycetota bacterium]|jgi:Ca2+-transporting ATPase
MEVTRGTLSGLSSEDAANLLLRDGPNEVAREKRKSFVMQALGVLAEPMLLLLLVAGAINFVIAEPLDGAMLMFFVLVVIGISIAQERKSSNALAALRELAAPKCRALRDGHEVTLETKLLVQGDIVLIGEGDRVPADAGILEATNASADESALTGESVTVDKFQGDTVFAGTVVTRGRVVARVSATGSRTSLGKIGKTLGELTNEKTPLQREVSRLILVVAAIAIAAAVIVASVYAFTRVDLLGGVLAGIATAMAMLPEEFPVVLTIFMALGAWRMSRVNVLARRPEVIETLGTATVICVDKTGTLTSNRMTVEGYYLGDLDAIAKAASFASALKPIDPMDIAFREKSELEGVVELVREYPLRADLLAVTHVWRLASGETYVAAKGAPEAIARMTGTAVPPEVALLAGKGLRVLAVAEARFEGKLPEDPAELGLKFVGLAALKDPVRPSVPAALAECYRAGIRTIMITGDYPNTALAIASEIGLECDAGALTGTEIAALSDAELAQKLTKVNVFARMLPEQKLRIIRALKTDGHVVAMTGDGVNDAPALKAADIGIAMGARGTDVAREAADLILTDDDFASIERGIKQGRGIFNNLRKAMTYIVAVHIPLLGMTLIPVFVSAWPLVLIPILIAALELIIDPACSVVFEAEEVDSNVMREKPRSAKEPVLRVRTLITAVLQGFGSLGLAVGVYLWALGSTFSSEEVRTVTFVSLVAMNLVLILSNRSKTLSIFASLRHRKNSSLKWLFSAVAVVISLLLFVPVIRDSFGLGVIGVAGWLAVSLATACALVWFEITKRLNR